MVKAEDLKHKHPQAGIFFSQYVAAIASIMYEFQLA